MVINIYWDDIEAKDVIRIDVIGEWTWKEYDEVSLITRPMFLSVEHRVDMIADLRESGTVPHSPHSTQHIKRGREVRPDNYGITVNIGADIVTKAVIAAGTTLSQRQIKRVYFSETLEEAYVIIRKDRQIDNQTNEESS